MQLRQLREKQMSTEKEHTLAKKLAEVAREVAYVQKDATNSFQKYKYASAEAVLRKVNVAARYPALLS